MKKFVGQEIQISNEKENNPFRVYNLKIESLSNKFDDEYCQAGMDFIKRMKTFADLLNQPHGADRLRTIIPLYIRAIRLQENGEFKIIMKKPECSTKWTKWCTW